MTTINPVNGLSPSAMNAASPNAAGDNPFLQLLTTQLRNQTPLEPMDNDSFMQQVATFSSMEEQRDLNTNMLALLDYQGLLARMQGLSQGSALLGKEVSFVQEGQEMKGTVDSVYVSENGTMRLRIGEQDIDMADVISIQESLEDPSTEENPTS